MNQVDQTYLMQCLKHMSQELADKLKAARQRLGLSQSQASKEWGVSKGTLVNWEQDRNTPRGLALKLLLERLDKILKDDPSRPKE